MTDTLSEPDVRRIALTVFQTSLADMGPRLGIVVAVSSPSRHEGVTYASHLICNELSRDPKRRTLYCTTMALAHTLISDEKSVEKRCHRASAGYWNLSPAGDRVTAWDFDPTARRSLIDTLRGLFDYVVLDCPAICETADMSSIAGLVNSVILVVGAGVSTKKQLAFAEKTIRLSGGNLIGCILNRRKGDSE